MKKKALGVEHPDYGASLHALAGVVKAQGKYGEAETLLRKSLALFEKALGVEHPSLYPTLTNLAVVLAQQERPAEAEPLVARALGIADRIHGLRHPETAQILIVLAQLQALLRRADAPRTAQQALDTLEATLGAEHPITRNEAPMLRQIVAGATPSPSAPNPASGFHARLQAALAQAQGGDPTGAAAAVTRLAEEAQQADAPGPEAMARIFLGQVLAATNQPDQAAIELRRALVLAEQIGDQDVAAHVRALLDGLD